MTYKRSPEFTKHAENFRAVRKGLVQVERLHKHAIRNSDDPATDTLARLHYVMIGLFAEAHLRKIVADPNGFNEDDRTSIKGQRRKLDQWTTAVALAFRRHYNVAVPLQLDASSLGLKVAGQFQSLTGLLKNELTTVIGDRNKLAHSQWVWLLNSPETGFKGPAPCPYNYSALEARARLVLEIGTLVNILTLSEPTFQRDYDMHMGNIGAAQRGLDGGSYPDLVRQLKAMRKLPPEAG